MNEDLTAIPFAATEAEADLATDRRNALKAGLTATLALGGALTATQVAAQKKVPAPKIPPRPPSPSTNAFRDLMPIIKELPQRPLTDPAFALPPTKAPNRTQNPATGYPYEGRGDAHQHRQLAEPQVFYAMRYGAVDPTTAYAIIHSDLPPQTNLWGANLGGSNLSASGIDADPPMSPLPTIVSRYSDHRVTIDPLTGLDPKTGLPPDNKAILIRRFNNLPTGAPSGGFGKNTISVHLHNFHTAPDSDGGPCDPTLGALSVDPLTQGRFFFPGQYYDHYYNMKRSGFIDTATYTANGTTKTTPANVVAKLNPAMPNGDVRETLSTLWYHDHREGATGANVYKGLAGFHLIFNEYDTGDENTGFKLPSYPDYDIPILATDIWVDPNTKQMSIDLANTNGHLGDKYLVNGKIQPYFPVAKRRYRFRLLNKGPSRFHRLYLTNPDNVAQSIPFWQISNDGNLLTKPLQVTNVKLAPAERVDVIIDFAKLTAVGGPAAGATRLWLENREVQTDPEKPAGSIDTAGRVVNALVEFRLGAVVVDNSADPATIGSFAPITLPSVPSPALTRTFNWDSVAGGWAVNGQLVDCTKVRFWMKRGRPERWVFNIGGGWAHPLHHHFVEGRITVRNGVTINNNSPEFSRKDVVPLYPGDSVTYIVTPTDFVGVYPYHCHNVIHEDYGMMLLFGVDDTGDSLTLP